jgi:hypothetical protein
MSCMSKWSINRVTNPNTLYSHTLSHDSIYTNFVPERFNAHNRGQAKTFKLYMHLNQNQENRNSEFSFLPP